MLDGKPFHTVGAATEKARVASAVCVRGTVNSGASEDRSNLIGGRSCSRSARCAKHKDYYSTLLPYRTRL